MELQYHLLFFTRKSTRKFHIINLTFIIFMVKWTIKLLQLWNRGMRNAEQLQITPCTMTLPDLPPQFDGYRILFASDLHIEGINALHERMIEQASHESYDICLLGGDYRLGNKGSSVTAIEHLSKLIPALRKKSRVIGILGNHDEYEIGKQLESLGVEMLINENRMIEKDGARIYFCGVDDSNYYAAHDLAQAMEGITEPAFKIIMSHSPDIYQEAADAGFAVYLAGHTHGGQLCLPGRIPVITETSAGRRFVHGHWQYRQMHGFTCAGAGCSALPIRFNCPPEMVLLTLRRAE